MIVTAAFDLKITSDGKPQILEFESSHFAGTTGYINVTGGRDMMSEVVYPDLRHILGLRTVMLRNETSGTWSAIKNQVKKELYDPSLRGTRALIITDPGRCIPWELLDLDARQNFFSVLNANPCFLSMMGDKAIFANIANQTIPQHIPQTLIVSMDVGENEECELYSKDFLTSAKNYFFKIPDLSQHRGIMIVKGCDVPEMVQAIRSRQYEKIKDPEISLAWKQSIFPYFIVQQSVENPFHVIHHKKPYDGTIRAFVSFWYDRKTRQHGAKFHDGWWKLPKRPITKSLRNVFDQSVSACPHEMLEKYQSGKTLRMPDHWKALGEWETSIVKDFLEKDLLAFYRFILLENMVLKGRKLLFSKDPTDQALGLVILSMRVCYNKPADYKGLREDAAVILRRAHDNPSSALNRYLWGVKRNPRFALPFSGITHVFSRFVLDKLRDDPDPPALYSVSSAENPLHLEIKEFCI